MPKKKIDNFSKEQLVEIVNSSYSMAEVIRKIGYSKHADSYKTVLNRLDEYDIDYSKIAVLKRVKRTEENTFCKNSDVSQKVLKEKYLEGNYSPYCCSICGLPPIWNGKPLVLTLDHINGDNNDNELINLRWICPNCDRQLPTYSSKNIIYQKQRVQDVKSFAFGN